MELPVSSSNETKNATITHVPNVWNTIDEHLGNPIFTDVWNDGYVNDVGGNWSLFSNISDNKGNETTNFAENGAIFWPGFCGTTGDPGVLWVGTARDLDQWTLLCIFVACRPCD